MEGQRCGFDGLLTHISIQVLFPISIHNGNPSEPLPKRGTFSNIDLSFSFFDAEYNMA